MKCTRIILALSALSALFSCGNGSGDFSGAEWISIPPEEIHENQWLCFRKSFRMDHVPDNAEISIATDTKYWMWINGEPAVFEGQLKRGPDRENTYYDKVSISEYLQEGQNTLAILVWHFGKGGFNHNDSHIPGLIADLRAGNTVVRTDGTWKVMEHPAFGESNPPHPNGRLPESNIRFDARDDIPGWTECGYDDSGWKSPHVYGKYPCEPWNLLVKRPFPIWKDLGLAPYDSLYQETSGDTTILYGVLPANLSITPYLKIKAPAGLMIDIRSDNYMFKDKSCTIRAEYITREGEQEFEALAYMNGHKVLYKLPAGVEVLDVKYRETRFNTEILGNFRCSDPFLNTLWDKCVTTMNLNMRDCIQDPDRERAQWWGDAVVVLEEILYSCDSNGRYLIKKAIDNLVDWQRADSVLFSPIPTGTPRKELPGQMLASIGQYGFWYYYYYTGDIETIRHAYPAARKYLGLWSLDEQGLVRHRKGDWDWHDWGSDIDGRMLDNAWFSLALKSMSEMADILGYEEDAVRYRRTMDTINAAVNRHWWTGEAYRSEGYGGKTDDRANGMAILAGFADREKAAKILDLLDTEFRAGPYLEKFIIESYFVQGDAERGIARMKKRYSEMVESPLTTLWEYWSTGGSINHGWAGGPMVIMSQYIAGIRPTDIAWKSFEVAPQTGGLEEVHCTVPSVSGTVRADITDRNGRFSVRVVTDKAMDFTIRIPKEKVVGHIVVNDRAFPASVMKNIRTGDITYAGEDGEHYIFSAKTDFAHITVN